MVRIAAHTLILAALSSVALATPTWSRHHHRVHPTSTDSDNCARYGKGGIPCRPRPTAPPSSASSAVVSTAATSSAAVQSLAPSSAAATTSLLAIAVPAPSSSATAPVPVTSTAVVQPATTSSAPPSASTSAAAALSASPATSDADIAAYLTAHNTVRAVHGAAPLSWNTTLAAKAQEWADKGKFVHSGGSLGPFGENLAASTGTFPIANAVKGWTDEASKYDPAVGFSEEAGHFTQVVWKATTQVGCGVATTEIFDVTKYGKTQFYVCEYAQQGNVIGQFLANVQV